MSNIYCTKKLEKLLGKPLMAKTTQDASPLGEWNANLFFLKGKKCVMLINAETCYCVMLVNILKADFKNFHQLFYDRLLEQLTYDQVPVNENQKKHLWDLTTPNFLPTNNNRKILGTMNLFIQDVQYIFEYHSGNDLATLNVPDLNHSITNNLASALGDETVSYKSPLEEMKKRLASFSPILPQLKNTTLNILTPKIEAFITKRRPPEHIRDKVDLSYTFENNVLEVFELRSHWKGTDEPIKSPIAKIKYVKTQKLWKLYWMRASGKWEGYPEMPESESLDECLQVVDEDRLCCFWG